MLFVIVFCKNYLYCIFLYGHKLMTILIFCLFSAINVFSKWFHTLEVLDLPLVVVLVGSCVFGTTVSCNAGDILCCSCFLLKKKPKILHALVMLTLKVEIWRILWRKNRMPTCTTITGICSMCVGCKTTIVNCIT